MPGRRTLTEAERQASDWIVRMNGEPSAAERAEFEAWRSADPANAAAFEALQRTWSKIAGNPALKGQAGANDIAPRHNSWARPVIAIAASALMAIGGLYWFTRSPTPVPGQHYVTAPAEIRTITLNDGSTITLSGAGEASVAIEENERRVHLTAGSALFDVVHDERRPFIVETPQGDIRVLGTEFVVRIAGDTVRTTVLRGSVSGAADRGGLLGGQSATVTAQVNEEIVLSQGNAELVEINAEAIPRRLAWRDNMLAFDGETLNQAIAEVSQQTGWQFELSDPSLGAERVGGYVHADPEAFIELMSTSLNLQAEREGERRVILSRRTAP
ncbi:MAG: FecR domain-containing protein [Hyphomonadaceae bacterium]|nr:FecR domain-containing protein [Hyphomonadaceae bacterium]